MRNIEPIAKATARAVWNFLEDVKESRASYRCDEYGIENGCLVAYFEDGLDMQKCYGLLCQLNEMLGGALSMGQSKSGSIKRMTAGLQPDALRVLGSEKF